MTLDFISILVLGAAMLLVIDVCCFLWLRYNARPLHAHPVQALRSRPHRSLWHDFV